MPELPEVETTMRALAARLSGRQFADVVQRRADLRFALPPGLGVRLRGRRLRRFCRRGKFIQAYLDDGQVLLLHLGMSGRLLLDAPAQGAHEHLTFAFDDGSVLRFVDPRRFGMLDLVEGEALPQHKWLIHLGLEPLADDFDGRRLLEALRHRHGAIKLVLMDQRVVVGVGNIYASEALHRAGISPRRLAANLGSCRAAHLAGAIRQVLSEAIDAGGSSLRDYVQSNGELGHFQNNFRVYDRAGQGCHRCAGKVQRIVLGGRATYFCGRCQR